MLDFSLLLRIYKITCRYISTKGFIKTALEFTNKRQYSNSIQERMDYPTKIEELWGGIQFLFRLILHVVSSFLLTRLATQATQEQ